MVTFYTSNLYHFTYQQCWNKNKKKRYLLKILKTVQKGLEKRPMIQVNGDDDNA